MEIIVQPLTEEEILTVVSEDVDGEEIIENMQNRAECCVDHLCGCR